LLSQLAVLLLGLLLIFPCTPKQKFLNSGHQFWDDFLLAFPIQAACLTARPFLPLSCTVLLTWASFFSKFVFRGINLLIILPSSVFGWAQPSSPSFSLWFSSVPFLSFFSHFLSPLPPHCPANWDSLNNGRKVILYCFTEDFKGTTSCSLTKVGENEVT
jgi:hypothetical protein